MVAAPGGNPGFATGDIVVLADCQQAAVFRVTGTAAIMAYAFGNIPHAIWFNIPPRAVLAGLTAGRDLRM